MQLKLNRPKIITAQRNTKKYLSEVFSKISKDNIMLPHNNASFHVAYYTLQLWLQKIYIK